MAKTRVSRKYSGKKQKLYNMRGCSKTRKHYSGGSPDAPLAYTGNPMPTVPNPFLSYTGKGGASCGLSKPSSVPINPNAANPAYPSTGAPIQWNTTFNNAQIGGCGCGMPMTGGNRGFMVGGVRHRVGCKCSKCKKRMMKGGNAGIPYPNGLAGSPWTSSVDGWPGVDGVGGNHNYFANNMYNNDVSRQMVDVGANPPFLKGGKRKQKGGNLTNFISQDLINLGRQFQFGMGSAYNALAGYASPVNPLPWKDQFPNRTPFNPVAI